MNNLFKFWLIILLIYTKAYGLSDNISIFPLESYSQNVDDWISPTNPDYNLILIDQSIQKIRSDDLKSRYFGTSDNDNSPWSKSYIDYILHKQNNKSICEGEKTILVAFSNKNQPENLLGYGINYKPYNNKWIDNIKLNINLEQICDNLIYNKQNRAIILDNTLVRALPSDDPYYYNYKIAGNGYPFDILQNSLLFTGAPVYILATSLDQQWQLILSPEVIGWVHSKNISRVDNKFLNDWQNLAKHKVGTIIKTNTTIFDSQNQYLRSGYIGTLLPIKDLSHKYTAIYVPIATELGGTKIKQAYIDHNAVTPMPMAFTPKNMATILKELVGRPYGWGGMGFYNDCSAELKAIFATFGIFLPRNSSQQVMAGQLSDVSHETLKNKQTLIIKNGRKLVTLIRIKGHVMLYVGPFNYNGNITPVQYSSIWGLSPKDRSRRAVLGGSVFLPLLESYPEDLTLTSLLDRPIVQMIFLDKLPPKPIKLNLKNLLY